MKICFGGIDFGVRIRFLSEWVFRLFVIEYIWIGRWKDIIILLW